MSQTIQGKTISGQLVDVKVDDDGGLVISNPGGTPTPQITKFDPSEKTPTYIGTNPSRTALDTDNTWTVLRFTRNGNGETTLVQQATGAWADRAALNYG